MGAQNKLVAEGSAYLKKAAGGAYNQLRGHLIQGPTGVKWLCFVGGLATVVLCLFSIASLWDVVFEPIMYVLWCYEFLFGVVTCILEAPDDWLEHAPDQPG